ncbi:glycerophosphodiester phosphodiesterase family protein [Flavivirga jejuensis]|uniref:Glycerophosphodiester phosphodiesterase family protein n=1 Tax=Flavivirga jejuensis TaxID=870487 RepID=A0ABT8WK63_9FLAO|nr:glycerophosphodiester phosphodiesterase family protein [Flavivirga jejuensis]MDO5973507.1 glycerophosphodiester phosphodiesterase family protein [Flavivirga jejuensis]
MCAHRSYHANQPENSIKSIKEAIHLGVDMVEIDVRTTKDNVLVLMHDEDIDRTTTGHGNLSDYSWPELLEFNLLHYDSITGQKIPKLEEVLSEAKGKLILNLDLKAVDYNQLYELLVKFDMTDDVISFIGKKQNVFKMTDIDSTYAVLPLSKNAQDITFYSNHTISSLQHFTDESFNKSNMALAKANKQLVFINTLWDEDVALAEGNTLPVDSVIALQPAIIQTDYPRLLLEHLKKIKRHD